MKNKLLLAILILILLYLGVVSFYILNSPLSYNEIDLDNNGLVDVNEAIYGGEIDERNITNDGKLCIEYFHFKDGLSAKVVCNE